MASAMQAPSAEPSTVAPSASSGQSLDGASASCDAAPLGFDSAGLSDAPAEHPVSMTAVASTTPTPHLLTRMAPPSRSVPMTVTRHALQHAKVGREVREAAPRKLR